MSGVFSDDTAERVAAVQGVRAAVPDPRFRDQLAVELAKAGVPYVNDRLRVGRSVIAERLEGFIAAEVDARVQAAASQRAAEELERAADAWMSAPAGTWPPDWLSARAAALAQPASHRGEIEPPTSVVRCRWGVPECSTPPHWAWL